MVVQTTLGGESVKAKPIIPADVAINWYVGNFIQSPNNALRDDAKYFQELDSGSEASSLLSQALKEMEKLRAELKGRMMTHREFMNLMKERGIHRKYYRYKKYENNCPICKAFGIR